MGGGGRMPGLSWASLKKNPMLIPLFFCLGVGATGATLYTIRLAVKSPEVTWHPNKNTEPWNDYKDRSYKFIKVQDTLPQKSPAPEY
ncbi:NADH dehydrogenase (ubiquinone) MLRQ subunit [Megachile rotundata]|uniref:NADH dehydrogenase (ubiquinone) MLRQ subunit n=1 Tax=Megachile rotundata TaxID=143995 RepID=UPI000258F1A3|nr:PREDICTED: cytochrome c oxidase subunit NDUFA4 [Megachile rotundata]